MSEAWIREIAARFGLTVEKRITTGNEKKHFATFELIGFTDQVYEAWRHIENKAEPHMARITHVTNPEHKDHLKPYIEIESVWCEAG